MLICLEVSPNTIAYVHGAGTIYYKGGVYFILLETGKQCGDNFKGGENSRNSGIVTLRYGV